MGPNNEAPGGARPGSPIGGEGAARTPRELPWYVWPILVAVGLLALWLSPRPPSAVSTAPQVEPSAAIAAPPPPCDSPWSRSYLTQLQTSGLIQRMDARESIDGLVLMVRPSAWAAASAIQRHQIASSADCAIAGELRHVGAVIVRDARTGADLAIYSRDDLIDLRRQRYGERPVG